LLVGFYGRWFFPDFKGKPRIIDILDVNGLGLNVIAQALKEKP